MSLGIQKKLAFTFTGFLVMAFALILLATLSSVGEVTKETIKRQQFAMTELTARSLDDKLGSILQEISQIGQLLPAGVFHNSRDARAFLQPYNRHLTVFDGLFLVDNEFNYLAGIPYSKELEGLKVVKLRPFLERVRGFGLPDFSEPYLSLQSKGPALAVAYPVDDARGRPLGFLVGRINLNKDNFVEDLISYKIGKKGYLFVINKQRRLILHPDKSRIMAADVPPGSNSFLEKALDGYEGSGETVNSRGVQQIISAKRLKTVDWLLATVYPKDEAYAELKHLRYLLSTSFIVVTLVSAALIWLMTMRITGNLNSFTRQIRAISDDSGQSNAITISGEDEIALLAGTFNDLMGRLNTARESLEEMTRTDPLTGLHNRRHFNEQAPTLVAMSERQKYCAALLMVDLDHFKRINDTYGHEVGDRVLVQVARVLRQSVRQYDLVIRHGGEEFLLLLPVTNCHEVAGIAERIRQAVGLLQIAVNDGVCTVTVSIGGWAGRSLGDINEAIVRADAALYQAKNSGRNQVRLVLDDSAHCSRAGENPILALAAAP
jgi:diguanylate cyclase (GGDEF)-like protein